MRVFSVKRVCFAIPRRISFPGFDPAMCAGAARSLCLYTRNTLCSGCHALSFCSDSLRLLNGFRSPRRFTGRYPGDPTILLSRHFLTAHPALPGRPASRPLFPDFPAPASVSGHRHQNLSKQQNSTAPHLQRASKFPKKLREFRAYEFTK